MEQIVFDPAELIEPQELEVSLQAPFPDTRLFIYTGVAIVPQTFQRPADDTLNRAEAMLSLSQRHNRRFLTAAGIVPPAPTAGLASILASDESDEFTWAVDEATARIRSSGELLLIVKLASQGELHRPLSGLFPPFFGEERQLARMAYQVNVLTHSATHRITLAELGSLNVAERRLSSGEVGRASVSLARPTKGETVEVRLHCDRPKLLSAPPSLKFAPGETSMEFDIKAQQLPKSLDQAEVSLTAFLPGSVRSTTLIVTSSSGKK